MKTFDDAKRTYYHNGEVIAEKMITFDDATHTYYYNGEVIANVSTILAETIFKDKYKNVPEHVLNNAASFGTNIHNAIEHMFPYGLDDVEYKKYQEYLSYVEQYFIITLEQEQIVHNKELNYVGRFDLVALIMGEKALCDVKTTYELDIEYLSWQLSMYYYGKRDFSIKKLYALWLPKRRKGGVVEIPFKTEQEVKWLVEKYYKENKK